MQGWGLNEWVAVGSAALALVSFLLNWRVVGRQTALQYETLKAEMDSATIAWAQEAIDCVSDAIGLARGRNLIAGDAFRARAIEVSQKLSSLADRGRLFFPNEAPHAHGKDKEGAFQGYRPPILDSVVFACVQVERMDADAHEPDAEASDYLVKCRRLLVSEVQNAIDPRRRSAMLRQLATGRLDDRVSSFQVASDLGMALEARYPGTLVEPRGPAWVAAREKYARLAAR